MAKNSKGLEKKGAFVINNVTLLRRAEARLEKKKKELLLVKKTHKKLAGQFIDLWVKVNKIKRQINSKQS